MSWIKNGLFVVASIAIFFLLLELLLQFLPVQSVTRNQGLSDTDEPFDVTSTADRNLNFSVGWNFRNARQRKTNNLGFPSDYDYERGTRSHLVIGDSYVEGLQVDFSATLHQQLASRLGEDVYNLSVSGAPLSQYQAYLTQACTEFVPKMVFFTIISNDFDESLFETRKRDGFFHYRQSELLATPYRIDTLRHLANSSAFVRYLYFHVGLGTAVSTFRSAQADATVSALAAAEAYEHPITLFLQNVDDLCVPKENIVLVVDASRPAVYQGLPREPSMAFFVRAAEAQGYRVLDLQRIFAEDFAENGIPFEFTYDHHWNDHAHRLVADHLYRATISKDP